jgi:hypothetical protein
MRLPKISNWNDGCHGRSPRLPLAEDLPVEQRLPVYMATETWASDRSFRELPVLMIGSYRAGACRLIYWAQTHADMVLRLRVCPHFEPRAQITRRRPLGGILGAVVEILLSSIERIILSLRPYEAALKMLGSGPISAPLLLCLLLFIISVLGSFPLSCNITPSIPSIL